MVEFVLNPLTDNAYKKVAEAIYDYVFNIGYDDTFIVKIAIGKNNMAVNYIREVAYKYNNSIEFFNDWWEGESYVAILGILPVTDVTDFDNIG